MGVFGDCEGTSVALRTYKLVTLRRSKLRNRRYKVLCGWGGQRDQRDVCGVWNDTVGAD